MPPRRMAARRMGRPGLIRTVGRTAVIAGTATAVAGGVSKRSASKQANQQAAADQQQQAMVDQAAAQAAAQVEAQSGAATGAEDPTVTKLKELAGLHDSGVLSDDEFAAAKANLLGI